MKIKMLYIVFFVIIMFFMLSCYNEVNKRIGVEVGISAAILTKANDIDKNMHVEVLLDDRNICQIDMLSGLKRRDSRTLSISAVKDQSKIKVVVRCNGNVKIREKAITGDLVDISTDCNQYKLPFIDIRITTKEALEKNGIEFPAHPL